MQKRIRAHPITILGNLWRVMYLIIIPVLRGFFLALQDNLAGWMAGAWVDIVILLLMVGLAVLRWRRVEFWWDERLFHIRAGFFLTGYTVIPWKKIVTVSVTAPFYLRPFRAQRLRLDAMGGSLRDSDFTILLGPEVSRQLLNRHNGPFPREKGYRPRTRSIVALSLLGSNSFAGIIFIAAFISQSGKLLGEEFSSGLIGAFEETARTLSFGLPPAAAAIAWLLLWGWAISFLLTFIRYKDMGVNASGSLQIRGGWLTKRKYSVNYHDISYIDIRQSLTAKLLGLYSLYICAVGYARKKEDIACLIPTEGAAIFERYRLRFFPRFSPAPRALAPENGGALRFIAPAVYPCAGIPLLTLLVWWRLESWGPFILFTGGMAIAPALVFMAVRIIDSRTGGVGKADNIYTLRYSKGFYLHTVVVEADKIVQVELRQGIFQRRSGRCDVLVRTRAEGRALHRMRSLPMQKARNLFT